MCVQIFKPKDIDALRKKITWSFLRTKCYAVLESLHVINRLLSTLETLDEIITL